MNLHKQNKTKQNKTKQNNEYLTNISVRDSKGFLQYQYYFDYHLSFVS